MGAGQSKAPSAGHPPSTAGMEPPPGCPMHASSSTDKSTGEGSSQLNPLNNMPELSQSAAARQLSALPLERTLSSIPRSSASAAGPSACPVAHSSSSTPAESSSAAAKDTWVYPSPQQFYNALVRKGWETPEESIPTMVAIHNWMNEAAWSEVLRWESRYFAPPQATATPAPAPPAPEDLDVSLTRFTGRPKELSPKARFHGMLAKIFPETYSAQPPFDRHDWMIRRDGWGDSERERTHRYVIDYYSAPDDENGNPVFHLDVRPAIDDLSSLRARLAEWSRVKREAWLGAGVESTMPAGRVEAIGQRE